MSIAEEILQAVATEAHRRPAGRPLRVGVRIGALAAIEPESLRFCFEALVKDTENEGLELAIERVPRRHRCASCHDEFAVQEFDFTCPRCGAWCPEVAGGDELELTYLELEDDEDPTATESAE
jgi:hydrogenase nickel incorporation protein HypA/HybF